MNAVKASHLKKVFYDARRKKETVAVETFDLDIEKGELVTLLGPSGCGKTTVLRMLAGFETPTSGQIFIAGKDITHLPANRRNSAMVFQSYALFPHMTVRENIVYGLKFRKVNKEETAKRLKNILEVVGLVEYESRQPHELSGGQQQRVALARALIIEPSLLLFDEPLSNLDAKLRESMRDEIRSVQQRLGITAVYVTHDQSEAMALSDRVVVMNKGRIEQVGDAQTIYLRPATKFVADFMGAANFIPAVVSRVENKSTVVKVGTAEITIPYQVAGKQAGEAILVVARPEQVRLATSGTGVPGTIKGYRYLGSSHEYTVELGALSKNVICRIESSTQHPCLKVGTNVQTSFISEELHLI